LKKNKNRRFEENESKINISMAFDVGRRLDPGQLMDHAVTRTFRGNKKLSL